MVFTMPLRLGQNSNDSVSGACRLSSLANLFDYHLTATRHPPRGQGVWFHSVSSIGHPFASSLAVSVSAEDDPCGNRRVTR